MFTVSAVVSELVESASKLHQKVAAELKSKRLGDMKQDGVWKKHCLSSGKQMVPDTGNFFYLKQIIKGQKGWKTLIYIFLQGFLQVLRIFKKL